MKYTITLRKRSTFRNCFIKIVYPQKVSLSKRLITHNLSDIVISLPIRQIRINTKKHWLKDFLHFLGCYKICIFYCSYWDAVEMFGKICRLNRIPISLTCINENHPIIWHQYIISLFLEFYLVILYNGRIIKIWR